MKKLFVALMVLTVLGGQVFANNGSRPKISEKKLANELDKRIHNKVQEAIKIKKIQGFVENTVAAMPEFLKEHEEYENDVRQEATKTFKVYFSLNPEGVVQESAYQPLAELLTAAIGLNRMIARTSNVDDRENFAIQWFFSQDIPGKYADLKAINPELAAATNELMKSFMPTVSNGTFYGGADHPDMRAMRAFMQDIGF